jgi:hypothetical protein
MCVCVYMKQLIIKHRTVSFVLQGIRRMCIGMGLVLKKMNRCVHIPPQMNHIGYDINNAIRTATRKLTIEDRHKLATYVRGVINCIRLYELNKPNNNGITNILRTYGPKLLQEIGSDDIEKHPGEIRNELQATTVQVAKVMGYLVDSEHVVNDEGRGIMMKIISDAIKLVSEIDPSNIWVQTTKAENQMRDNMVTAIMEHF